MAHIARYIQISATLPILELIIEKIQVWLEIMTSRYYVIKICEHSQHVYFVVSAIKGEINR